MSIIYDEDTAVYTKDAGFLARKGQSKAFRQVFSLVADGNSIATLSDDVIITTIIIASNCHGDVAGGDVESDFIFGESAADARVIIKTYSSAEAGVNRATNSIIPLNLFAGRNYRIGAFQTSSGTAIGVTLVSVIGYYTT